MYCFCLRTSNLEKRHIQLWKISISREAFLSPEKNFSKKSETSLGQKSVAVFNPVNKIHL